VYSACVIALSGIYNGVHLGEEGNFLPVITTDIAGHSKFLHSHTNYFEFLCAGDCINFRNESKKYHRSWGANLRPLALQESALATEPE